MHCPESDKIVYIKNYNIREEPEVEQLPTSPRPPPRHSGKKGSAPSGTGKISPTGSPSSSQTTEVPKNVLREWPGRCILSPLPQGT